MRQGGRGCEGWLKAFPRYKCVTVSGIASVLSNVFPVVREAK